MTIPKINSAHGSDTRNIINRAIDLINTQGKSIQDLVAEGQLSPEQYSQLLKEVNGLIAKGNVSVDDINKNLGKFDGTWFTSDFLEDLKDGEINTTNLLDKSVTKEKIANKAVTSSKLDIPYNGLAKTYDFEPGAYSTADGVMYNAPDSVRTKELIYLEKGDKVEVDDENTEFIILKYEESGVFIERVRSGWAKTYTADENMYIMINQRFVNRDVISDASYFSNNLFILGKETFTTGNEVENKIETMLSSLEKPTLSNLEKTQYETDLFNNNYGDVIDTIENELVIPPGSFYSYYTYQNENDFEKGKTLYFLVETNKIDGSWEKEICIRENGGGGGTNEKRTNSEHLGDGVYLVTHTHLRDPDDRVHAFVNNMTFEDPLTVYKAVLLYDGVDGREIDRRIKKVASTITTEVDVSSLHDRIAILNDGIIDLVDRINAEKGIKKTWKLLSIGNSFSGNVQKFLSGIATSAGVNIIYANAAIGGSTLEQNYINATTGETYGYSKNLSIDGVQSSESGSVTISEAVMDEDWDIITLQQGSRYSGLYESYQPHLNNLINYIRNRATNPLMKIVWHMTWAYATHTSGGPFLNYNNDQQIMYDGIMSSVKNVLKETEIHSIIPSGTAIQNARTSDVLNGDGMELTLSDGHHLNDLGCFVGGLTVFESLLSGSKTLDDVTFIPTDITETQAAQAKIAAENAVKTPFSVTEM